MFRKAPTLPTAFSGVALGRAAIVAVAFGSAPALASSWTLSQAVERGIAVQAQVAAAADRARASRDLAAASTANRLPQLSLQMGGIWSASRQGQPLFVSANGSEESIAELVVTAPIFDAQLQALAKLAHDGALVAAYQVDQARLQTAAAVTNAWFGLGLAQEQTALWRQTVDQETQLVARSQKAFRAGSVARMDLVQTELLLTQARNQYAQAKVQQQTAERALNLQLDLPATAATTLATAALAGPMPVPTRTALWQQMQAKQPLLQVAQRQIQVAEAQKSVQEASYLPVLNAQLAYGVDSSGVPRGHDLGWQAGLRLDFPLFGFGRRQASVAAAGAQVAAVRADKAALLLQMRNRLNQDWGAFRAAQENARRADKIVHQAEAVYDMTRKGFQDGAINALNLAQAQNAWIQARLNSVQARLRLHMAYTQLLLDEGQIP
ncbi:TolC family protein [Candidatus Igneacidithiobacillus taiwanensis]|uniref:TolC family protein n=1 Tax=Candidatus Igneacidithiobacillus taiwanensis TaxID=1945924 RepID=UPI00289A274D|nr:TolC family protein [Candidatus Igneacidithiobacillus taiwanensis]